MNSFRRNGTSSFLYLWQNLAVNPSGPGLFFISSLLIAASISDLVIGLFMVSIILGLGLGGCKCPGIYPFLPGFLVYEELLAGRIIEFY